MENPASFRKVAIITFLHNANYGSILQAYALQQVIRSMGFVPCHLNYMPDIREKTANLLSNRNSPALVVEGLQKRRAAKQEPMARRKAAAFARFMKEQLTLTPPLRNRKALLAAAEGFDTILCGSDQIWSPTWLNTAYYLDFVPEGKHKVAYAPSLGVQHLPSARKCAIIRKRIGDIHWISVREPSGQKLLGSISQRKDIAVVLDPVCLLPQNHWLGMAVPPPPRKRPYVLCYFIGNHPRCWRTVEFIADSLQADILVVPVTADAYRLPYTLAGGLSPQEWLGYLAAARCVITDSFHCVAFSTMFQRDFLFVKRDADGDPLSRNGRILDFLRLLGADTATRATQWETSAARLAHYRERSLAWLMHALEASQGDMSP